MTLNPLARAYDAPFDPPRTVGDVLSLYTQGELSKIHGLGRRRISEIEAALVLAGIDITGSAQTTGHLHAGEGPVSVSSPGSAAPIPPRPGTPGVNPGGGG